MKYVAKLTIWILLIVILFALVYSCTKSNDRSSPSCELFVSPIQGDTTTVFFLSGENSTIQENVPFGLSYYWMLDDSIQVESDSRSNKATIKINSYGIHRIRLTVEDSWGNTDTKTDTILVVENFKDSICIDPRDGQTYRIVKFGDYWWFTENLRYGSKLAVGEVPQDNGIVERYVQNSYSQDISGYYSWQEAHHYSLQPDTSICPPGWVLPNNQSVRYFFNFVGKFEFEDSRQMFLNGCFSKLNFRTDGYFFDMDSTLFKQYTPSFWMTSEIIKDANDNYFSDMIYFWGSSPILISWNIMAVTRQDWYPKSQIAVPIRCIKKN